MKDLGEGDVMHCLTWNRNKNYKIIYRWGASLSEHALYCLSLSAVSQCRDSEHGKQNFVSSQGSYYSE